MPEQPRERRWPGTSRRYRSLVGSLFRAPGASLRYARQCLAKPSFLCGLTLGQRARVRKRETSIVAVCSSEMRGDHLRAVLRFPSRSRGPLRSAPACVVPVGATSISLQDGGGSSGNTSTGCWNTAAVRGSDVAGEDCRGRLRGEDLQTDLWRSGFSEAPSVRCRSASRRRFRPQRHDVARRHPVGLPGDMHQRVTIRAFVGDHPARQFAGLCFVVVKAAIAPAARYRDSLVVLLAAAGGGVCLNVPIQRQSALGCPVPRAMKSSGDRYREGVSRRQRAATCSLPM